MPRKNNNPLSLVYDRGPIVLNLEYFEWAEKGACRRYDPDLWFTQGAVPEMTAKRICESLCSEEIRKQCLAFALNYKQEGVWGGTTTDERRRMNMPGIKLPTLDLSA